MKKRIPLFDEQGSCMLCSTTYVKRRVELAERLPHAMAHKKQGDGIIIDVNADEAFILEYEDSEVLSPVMGSPLPDENAKAPEGKLKSVLDILNAWDNEKRTKAALKRIRTASKALGLTDGETIQLEIVMEYRDTQGELYPNVK